MECRRTDGRTAFHSYNIDFKKYFGIYNYTHNFDFGNVVHVCAGEHLKDQRNFKDDEYEF